MKKEFFSKLKKTGNSKEINGLTCEEYELTEKAEDVDEATIWVSKTMLDRMTGNLEMMDELKKLGADEMMIGFPMKGSFTIDGQKGSFEVTKITEGESALADFDLSKMKKMSPNSQLPPDLMARRMSLRKTPRIMQPFARARQASSAALTARL